MIKTTMTKISFYYRPSALNSLPTTSPSPSPTSPVLSTMTVNGIQVTATESNLSFAAIPEQQFDAQGAQVPLMNYIAVLFVPSKSAFQYRDLIVRFQSMPDALEVAKKLASLFDHHQFVDLSMPVLQQSRYYREDFLPWFREYITSKNSKVWIAGEHCQTVFDMSLAQCWSSFKPLK